MHPERHSVRLAEKKPSLKLVELKNILFATDFSECSLLALSHVAAIARRYESKVYLAHVIVSETYPLVSPEIGASRTEQIAQHAKQQLGELSSQLRGIPNEFLLAYGDVTDALAGMIKDYKIDLVVVGTHGRRGFKRFLLGSIAEEMFRGSPCPVLTVGPHLSKQAPQEIAFKNVLYPTDLSKESNCAAPYAVSLASEYGANLTLLHVLSAASTTYPDLEALKATFRNQLKTLIPPEAEPWCNPEFDVELGEAVATILGVSRKRQADLIVLGVKEADPLASHLQGNIAYRIVTGAECPTLTVRANSDGQD